MTLGPSLQGPRLPLGQGQSGQKPHSLQLASLYVLTDLALGALGEGPGAHLAPESCRAFGPFEGGCRSTSGHPLNLTVFG